MLLRRPFLPPQSGPKYKARIRLISILLRAVSTTLFLAWLTRRLVLPGFLTTPVPAGPVVIYPFTHWGEGIGSISISSKRCGLLAMELSGTLHVPDYMPGGHGYRISEALDTISRSLPRGRPLGKVCAVGNYENAPGWEMASVYECGQNNTRMQALLANLLNDRCDTIVCDFRGDQLHGGTDVLQWLHGEANNQFKRSLEPSDTVRIHAHIRWGDSAAGSESAGYGRAKSADMGALGRYVRHLQQNGTSYNITVFSELGPDGSLPNIPQLDGIDFGWFLDGDIRKVIVELGQCDIFFTGGSQMAVLASAISAAPTVIFPDTEHDYFMDSCRYNTKFVAAKKFTEDLEAASYVELT